MRALAWVAMGFVVVLLDVTLNGWDVLADPLGWVLVLVGVRALPAGVEHRAVLALLAGLSLVEAAVAWPPAVADRLADADPALVWALGLPELAFVVLLAHVLTEAARRAGDVRAAAWWSGLRTLTIVVALLPPVIFGGGVDQLAGVAAFLGVLSLLGLVVLGFAHGARPWAGGPAPTAAD